MTVTRTQSARAAALIVLVAATASCGLPRSGPTKSEIMASTSEARGDAYIVEVDDRVSRAIPIDPPLTFSPAFINAGIVGSDEIRPGDALSLTIWENVDDGLLSSQGFGSTQLSQMQVDGAGFIFVPYAGRILAAGNSPEALRRIITAKLETQTPDPQVTVSRAAGDGATVSIMGGTGGQGIFPIERPTRTLSTMLAKAGGISIVPELVQITVTRGSQTGKIWLKDLYSNPSLDIALRPGDVILVEEDTRDYTVLGAAGGQTRVKFETPKLSAVEALAQVGGLSSAIANPKGIFIFRDDPVETANAVLGRTDLIGTQRMIYVIDLTKPSGVFIARDFMIRDGDTIYVTEAPFVRWQKTIAALTGSLNTANSLNSLAGN